MLASDLEAARRLMARLEDVQPDLYIGEYPGDPRCFNALCVCPARGAIPGGYRRMALAGLPAECVSGTGAEAFSLPGEPAWRRELPDLPAMREAYRALAELMKRPAWARSLAELAHMVGAEAGLPDISAAASLLAMADMGLIELDLAARPIAVRRTRLSKADPGHSAVWNALQRWRLE